MITPRAHHRADTILTDLWDGQAATSGHWPLSPVDSPRISRRLIPALATAPGTARAFLRDTVAEWGLGDLAEDARTVISELTTNALTHGGPETPYARQPWDIQVILLGHDQHLTVVVADPGTERPAMLQTGALAESGRGLQIVDALAGGWGWARLTTGGTAVWAIFHREGRTPATGPLEGLRAAG